MEQIIIKPIHILQSDPNSVTSATPIDVLPCELPKFFESKENRSQKIISRLKEIEKKVGDEVESTRQMQNEDEKVPAEFLEEIKKIVQEKIDELKEKTIFQMDLILVSEILDNLAKSEENLLNFVQISFDNYTHLHEVDDDETEEPKVASGGILKKPIAKTERQNLGKRKKIPYKAVTLLKQWLFENIQDPYPSNEVKEELAKKTGLTFKQVHNWFINARGRIWKKMVNPERFGNVVEKLYVQNVAKGNAKK